MTTVARLKELSRRPRVVLDIKGLLMHSYHSGKDPEPVRGSDGKSINTAGYGLEVFVNRYLEPILAGFTPIDIIAAWDGGNAFRKSVFPDYKKQREADREQEDKTQRNELDRLLDLAKKLLANLGAINMYVDGVEADDVIALLCEKMPGSLMIYTVDADLLQLSSEKVIVSSRDQFSDSDTYEGLPLRYIPILKSLVGDKSDGYGGIKGFGPAAMKKLIELYDLDVLDDLEDMVKNKKFDELKQCADEQNCKLLKLIWEQRTEWQIMYKIACLHPELCYQVKRNNKIEPLFYTRAPNADKVKAILAEAKSPHLFNKFSKLFGSFRLADQTSYDSITDHLLANLNSSPVVGFDFETYDPVKHQPFIDALSEQAKERGFVDTLSSIPAGGSFTYGNNLQYTFYVPEAHKDTANVDDGVSIILRHLVEEWGGPLCVHNAAFEEQIARQAYGIQLERPLDTLIMSSYVDENKRGGLKGLSKILLGYTQQSFTDLLAEAGAEDMRGVTGQQVLNYGCDDALMSAHLWKLFDLVTTIEGVNDFYVESETATVHVLNAAFETGVNVDYLRMRELQEIDRETVVKGMIEIRKLLREHCQEENRDNAKAFYEADYEAHRAKLMEKGSAKGWTKDKVRAELEGIELGYIEKTKYVDYIQVPPTLDFSPTPTSVNKVITALGFVGDPEVKLKSLSGSAITDFLVQNPPKDERSEEFCGFLAAHAKQLNKAKVYAAELTEFNKFCASVLVEKMSPVTMGDELSIGSPRQMAELFYLKLGLPVRERTNKTKGSFRDLNGLPGSPSTDEAAVNSALLFDCPEGDWRRGFLKTLLDVKEAMTRESLFYKPYPNWQHPRDGMMHPQFRNCGTVTRRPAGTSPNLLQVSKGDLRTIFIPRYTGHVIIPSDFSGQELRITGSESKDPTLIQCYVGGGTWTDEDGMVHPVTRDVHSVTACAFATDIIIKDMGREFVQMCVLDSGGFVDYDWFRLVYGWEKGRDEVIPGLGELTEKFSKAFNKARKMAKTVNFLIIYGGNHFTLAKKLGIDTDFAERLMDMVFLSYARLSKWQDETIEFAEKYGYVQTAYGTRRHVTDAIMSRDGGAKARMERQAVNATVQGCLQAGSLVATDRGLIPIQDLIGEVFEADTGFGFFTATAINMGRSTAARITTSSGLVINCDVRHKVKNDRRDWVEFPDLAVGDFIALPKLADSNFSTEDYNVDWDFVVGYWMGDGSLTKRKGSRPTDTHSRSTLALVGGVKKKPLLEAMYDFFVSEGLFPTKGETLKPNAKDPVYRVILNRKSDIEVVESKGVTTEKSKTKRVPPIILSGSHSTREQFLRGFLLADGARTVGYRVHTPNDALLSDLQILAGSLGLDSGKFETKSAGYVEFSNQHRGKRIYPFHSLQADVEEVNGVGCQLPCSRGDNESIVNRRGYQDEVVTQPVAERILRKHTKVTELYRFDTIVKLEVLNYEVETYTLAVDHPLHQFVADGVIHKNCAADILKVVFNSCYETKLFEQTKSVLIAPVYDEVTSSVPVHNAVEYIFRLQDIMNITPPGHAIPMMAEVSIGRNWGAKEELGDHPSERKIEAAIERAFAA